MPVSKSPRKELTLSVPLATYESLKDLAAETNRTIPGYIRYLIACDLIKRGLPLYSSSER